LKGYRKFYLQWFTNLVFQHLLSFLHLLKDYGIFSLKNLHTLHVSKLNLSNKIKNLQLVHITKLIWINLITCTRYIMTIEKKFYKLIAKNLYIYIWFFLKNIFSLNSKIMGMNMTMDFYDKKCTNVWSAHKLNNCRHVYFLWCIIVTKPITNAQHQHSCTCNKKNHVLCKFHYPLPPMHATKNLKPFQNKWELSIFTIKPPYISKKNISIFKRLKRKWWYIIF